MVLRFGLGASCLLNSTLPLELLQQACCPVWPGQKHKTLFENKEERAGGMAQVVELTSTRPPVGKNKTKQ
jgi:hypothetical protein